MAMVKSEIALITVLYTNYMIIAMSGIKIGFIAFIEEISIHKTFEPACTQSFSFSLLWF